MRVDGTLFFSWAYEHVDPCWDINASRSALIFILISGMFQRWSMLWKTFSLVLGVHGTSELFLTYNLFSIPPNLNQNDPIWPIYDLRHSANVPLANLIPMHISVYDESDYESPVDSQQLMAGEGIHALLAAHGVWFFDQRIGVGGIAWAEIIFYNSYNKSDVKSLLCCCLRKLIHANHC